MAALAAASERPAGPAEETFSRLRRQAAVQVKGKNGPPCYELLDQERERGLEELPPPARGDVFFDMEGDPLYEIGLGLEYLFGVYLSDEPDEQRRYVSFRATDRDGERLAFEQCVDFMTSRLKAIPSVHLPLRALREECSTAASQRYSSRADDEVDDLFRDGALVDLYPIVRKALVVSQPSYSIKKLEVFYGFAVRGRGTGRRLNRAVRAVAADA